MQRTVAVFDFDGTLTTKDTLIEFIRFAKGTPKFLLGFLLFSPLMVLMKLKLYDNGRCKEQVLSWFFKGMPHEEFAELGRRFAQRVKAIARQETHEALARHKAKGDTIYVISASIEEWVRPYCDTLGVTKVLGTQLGVDSNGRLTGRFASPNCYGGDKVRRLLTEEPDRDSYTLYAYGDSSGDNEMFALADNKTKI